jgi:hypothetical protein
VNVAKVAKVAILIGAAACVVMMIAIFEGTDCTRNPGGIGYICDTFDKVIISGEPPTTEEKLLAYIPEVVAGGAGIAGIAWGVLWLLAKFDVGD